MSNYENIKTVIMLAEMPGEQRKIGLESLNNLQSCLDKNVVKAAKLDASLILLNDAFEALDEVSDIAHYEDGEPCTYLSTRQIGDIYTISITPSHSIYNFLVDNGVKIKADKAA